MTGHATPVRKLDTLPVSGITPIWERSWGYTITNTRVSVALRDSAVSGPQPGRYDAGRIRDLQAAGPNNRIDTVGQRLRVLNVSHYHMQDPSIVCLKPGPVNLPPGLTGARRHFVTPDTVLTGTIIAPRR
jgi:hypothetical protein